MHQPHAVYLLASLIKTLSYAFICISRRGMILAEAPQHICNELLKANTPWDERPCLEEQENIKCCKHIKLLLPSWLKGNKLSGIYVPNKVYTLHLPCNTINVFFSAKPCLIFLNTKMQTFFIVYTAVVTANTDMRKSSSLQCGEWTTISDTFKPDRIKPLPHHMRSSGNSIVLC